jgi:hypothetical protein
MKTKNLFLTVVLLFIVTFNYAQTSAEASGIAIQGIARDANNTARINTPITLTVEIYYINDSNQPVNIAGPEDKDLTTDNFGVFSFVLEAGEDNNAIMANHQAYLKISEGSTTISDEKLNHVPYAIAANNGVPTGSIMPFVGTSSDVPAGWALCNGQTLPTTATKLIAMIGNNAPNLGGMFLRGAGTNDLTDVTTTLGEVQTHTSKSHSHNDNFAVTGAGIHQHTITTQRDEGGATGDNSGQFNWTGQPNNDGTQTSSTNTGEGNHTHGISGGVFGSGQTDNTTGVWGTETRPVNYGVNYIIKL